MGKVWRCFVASVIVKWIYSLSATYRTSCLHCYYYQCCTYTLHTFTVLRFVNYGHTRQFPLQNLWEIWQKWRTIPKRFCWMFVKFGGQQLALCWPTVGWLAAVCQPSVSRQTQHLANSLPYVSDYTVKCWLMSALSLLFSKCEWV